MHLPTGSDSSDPIRAMCYFRDDTPDTEDYSLPPGARTLLGPAKMRNDLVIFSRRERKNLPGFSNEGCPSTSGSDVDRKQEILFHEQHRLQSTKNSSLLANSSSNRYRPRPRSLNVATDRWRSEILIFYILYRTND
jgi:hypothetical protein